MVSLSPWSQTFMCFRMISDTQVNVILAELVPPVKGTGFPLPFPSSDTQIHPPLKAVSQVLCEEMVLGDMTFIR